MGQFFKTKKDRQKLMDDNKKTLDRIKKEKILNDLKKIEEKKKITQTNNNKNDGPGSWGGHGSVQAYDKSQQATYDRAMDRHRGAKGGFVRGSYFDGGIVSLRRR